jgi:WD40 repeat protein
VDPFPLLVSADFGGNIAIWAVPAPSGRQPKFVNEVLTRFINMQSLESSAPVNCLDPVCEASGNVFTLYTGDEDGDVRAWDLSKLLSAAELEPCKAKADWDPFFRGGLEAAPTAIAMARKALLPETAELPIKVDQQVVRQLPGWRAHNDSVRSIKVYSSPECIVTAGYDHMVKIWNMNGTLMTLLRAYGATPWNFPVQPDNVGVDDATLEEVMKAIKTDNKTRAQAELRHKLRHRNTKPAFSLAAEVEMHNQRITDDQQRLHHMYEKPSPGMAEKGYPRLPVSRSET